MAVKGTPKTARWSTSTSGTTLVTFAGPSGTSIRILACHIAGGAAVNASLVTDSGTVLGPHAQATGALSLAYNEIGWGDATAGEDLDLTLSGAVTCSGSVTYTYV